MTRPLVPLAQLLEAVRQQSGGRLQARLMGPTDGVAVNNIATLLKAGPADVAFLANPRYRFQVAGCTAGVIVISDEDRIAVWGEAEPPRALIVTTHPYVWFAFALQAFFPPHRGPKGIHPSAVIDPSAKVAASASVGANAVIQAGAQVGEGSWIGAGCVVGEGARIGCRTQLHPNVTIAYGCSVGDDCILHSGCVIGADGFGFAPFEGTWVKIPQIGAVVIGNHVEIGANTSIDRGALDDTVIEDGVILDNQIQIGHNCRIGAGTAMAGCVGVAGSARIGRNVQVGGAAMIGGHLSIPDGTLIGPATSIPGTIKEAGRYTGFFPVMEHHDFERTAVMLRRLKDMRRQIKDLTARLEKGN